MIKSHATKLRPRYLLMQTPGVYVANLEDKDGDHSHAVALDLRDPAAAAIIDAADEQARLPLNDENLQRCCSGVECVGCHRLARVIYNPPKSEEERATKERARKKEQRQRKRAREQALAGDGRGLEKQLKTNMV